MIIDSEILQYVGSSIYFSLIKLEKKDRKRRREKGRKRWGVSYIKVKVI